MSQGRPTGSDRGIDPVAVRFPLGHGRSYGPVALPSNPQVSALGDDHAPASMQVSDLHPSRAPEVIRRSTLVITFIATLAGVVPPPVLPGPGHAQYPNLPGSGRPRGAGGQRKMLDKAGCREYA